MRLLMAPSSIAKIIAISLMIGFVLGLVVATRVAGDHALATSFQQTFDTAIGRLTDGGVATSATMSLVSGANIL